MRKVIYVTLFIIIMAGLGYALPAGLSWSITRLDKCWAPVYVKRDNGPLLPEPVYLPGYVKQAPRGANIQPGGEILIAPALTNVELAER